MQDLESDCLRPLPERPGGRPEPDPAVPREAARRSEGAAASAPCGSLSFWASVSPAVQWAGRDVRSDAQGFVIPAPLTSTPFLVVAV